MVADDVNHPGGCLQMNTGERVATRPSLGSWVTYGLGTENQNLPGFIAIGPGPLIEGARQYGAAFLPAAYQGTFVSDLKNPIRNLKNDRVSPDRQRRELDALRRLNELHGADRAEDSRLSARIESFELAYRMQVQAPDAFDLARETARRSSTSTASTARRPRPSAGSACWRGGWSSAACASCSSITRPAASSRGTSTATSRAATRRTPWRPTAPSPGLLKDLQARGLLEDTLVIWGGEFGRTPAAEGTNGRDHHPYGFTMWLAGGGVRGGMAHGATDEFGWDAVQDRVHVHDLHATILHLLGLDHEKLTYRHSGRDYRLTDVYGVPVKAIIT